MKNFSFLCFVALVLFCLATVNVSIAQQALPPANGSTMQLFKTNESSVDAKTQQGGGKAAIAGRKGGKAALQQSALSVQQLNAIRNGMAQKGTPVPPDKMKAASLPNAGMAVPGNKGSVK